MGNLAGIFVSLIGGIIVDRSGTKWILTTACILVGITGAARGLSGDFLTLSIAMLANGVVRLIIPVIITRTIGLWFKGRNLGTAMGISAMGMGLGLSLGPILSSTYLSPLLGGWRNVLFLYGGVSAFIGILWFLFAKEPPMDAAEETAGKISVLQTISRLIRIKALWFVGLTFTLRMGSIMGMTGYLPLFLIDYRAWPEASADATLAAFYAVSALCVVPLTSLSDKIGSRKLILYMGVIANTVSLSLIPVVDGAAIWVLMVISGIFMDGFMAINTTILLETEGVGTKYSGTALGLIFTVGHIGSVSSPPIGNSFGGIDPGLPFTFWAVLSILGLATLAMIKETGYRKKLFWKIT
jgi:NNP family nitrate/nitrite transporter-like MFS transporter